MNELMSNKAVYRTAPATPGLLKRVLSTGVFYKRGFKNESYTRKMLWQGGLYKKEFFFYCMTNFGLCDLITFC